MINVSGMSLSRTRRQSPDHARYNSAIGTKRTVMYFEQKLKPRAAPKNAYKRGVGSAIKRKNKSIERDQKNISGTSGVMTSEPSPRNGESKTKISHWLFCFSSRNGSRMRDQ